MCSSDLVSALDELSLNHFHNVLDDDDALDPLAAKRIVLCSGKVYFDLLEQRREAHRRA